MPKLDTERGQILLSIVRDWYRIDDYRLTADGSCGECGTALAGRFAEQAENFGRRRIPVAINRQ